MRFVADMHLHSRFARATSKSLTPENLYRWGRLKGLGLVGTGDFTHPEWFAELQTYLKPSESGLFSLKTDCRKAVDQTLPKACVGDVCFILSVEISLIYKKNGKTRKVHHVVMMPSFDAAEELNRRLAKIGNLASDGRPILGLDSRDLVAICLDVCEDMLFVPAHIWTPHFAVLGARSGFDSLAECFEDMLPYILAVETGLSSDPEMNRRVSMLDGLALVSNSDAHSPQKLGREATCFDTDLSYWGILGALKDPHHIGLNGTLEFYPEEGKYHNDGHRKCGVSCSPRVSKKTDNMCPVCGKPLTMGVLHRVDMLSDRADGFVREGAKPYEKLIPLVDMIGAVKNMGTQSKRVQRTYESMLTELGPELEILRTIPIEEIARASDAELGEHIRQMRAGELEIEPGFDGVFGKVRTRRKEG